MNNIIKEIVLVKYENFSYEQKDLLPMTFSNQILTDTFEHPLNFRIDDLDLYILRNGLQMMKQEFSLTILLYN